MWARAVVVSETGWVREVSLHDGPVKTGSTFLQDLLWRYRTDLARQGTTTRGAHENKTWLGTNDVQDKAFVNYESCRRTPPSGSSARARQAPCHPITWNYRIHSRTGIQLVCIGVSGLVVRRGID